MIDVLLDALEDMCRQHCHSAQDGEVHSNCLSCNADALEILAKNGRFIIERQFGRMVVGKWPDANQS